MAWYCNGGGSALASCILDPQPLKGSCQMTKEALDMKIVPARESKVINICLDSGSKAMMDVIPLVHPREGDVKRGHSW